MVLDATAARRGRAVVRMLLLDADDIGTGTWTVLLGPACPLYWYLEAAAAAIVNIVAAGRS